MDSSKKEQAETAVALLKQFLSINTSHPAPDYQVSPLSDRYFVQEVL